MKKNKLRYLILIFSSLLLFTGCSAEYNLTVLNDLSLYEYIVVTDGEDKYNKASDMISAVKEEYGHDYTIYQHVYDDEFETNIQYYGLDALKKYSSYKDYSSKVVSEYFGNVSLTKSGSKFTLKATPGNQISSFMSDVNYIKASLDELTVNVSVPFKVISNNADSSNNNTYTWNYRKDDYDRKIELVFDISDKTDYNGSVDNNDKDSSTTKNSNSYLKYVVILLGVVIVGVIWFFINKREKNNSI